MYLRIPIWSLNWCPFSVRFLISFPQQLPAKRNGYNKHTDVIYLKELFADIITLYRLSHIWGYLSDPSFFLICAKEVGRHHFINLCKKASRAAETKTRRKKGRARFFLLPSPPHFLAFVSIFMLSSEENASILCRLLLFYLKGLVS